jgi:hypothetical protein
MDADEARKTRNASLSLSKMRLRVDVAQLKGRAAELTLI